MILCDIGNTSVNFLKEEKAYTLSVEEFRGYKTQEKVFYISVNDSLNELLKAHKNYLNIEAYFKFDTIYKGLGIDRVAACYTISDGVVVDAGSAITVDIITNSMHLGGFIMPGLEAYKKAYEDISPRLKYILNTAVELNAYPQQTSDAISYCVFKSIYLLIKDASKDLPLYFTGGDGQFLSKLFDKAIYDKNLVFKGMQKLINQRFKA